MIPKIMHGILAHKNQSFHRTLVRRLDEQRGLDSFRWDLRGQGGESEGLFGNANFDDDVVDLERVIEYLKIEYGYKVHISTSLSLFLVRKTRCRTRRTRS